MIMTTALFYNVLLALEILSTTRATVNVKVVTTIVIINNYN